MRASSAVESRDAPILGCIADDLTGGTDVAAGLRRAGLRTVLRFALPTPSEALPPCDAVVVALKSRTVAVADAIEMSLTAQRWLVSNGVERLYFKYCSTFDSTDEGNIGPVLDALLDATGERQTILCPASPEHGRTTYLGHHYVLGRLLSESSMRHHPLTPMTDPDLVRVLTRQTPNRVGLLALDDVRAGKDSVRDALVRLAAEGVRHVIADATCDEDLTTIAAGSAHLSVITGGAGLARALGALALVGRGVPLTASARHNSTPAVVGPAVVISGSCSATTLAQVEHAAAVMPTHRLDPVATPDPARMLARALAWLDEQDGAGPVLVTSSADAELRDSHVAAMGPATAEHLEEVLASVARAAVTGGARRVIVAGGETAGAVVTALGVRTVIVGEEADTGVPWCVTTDEDPIALLLKSGNFGRIDLLARAAEGSR
jgi:3-dehydrotetronate 4-kinase